MESRRVLYAGAAFVVACVIGGSLLSERQQSLRSQSTRDHPVAPTPFAWLGASEGPMPPLSSSYWHWSGPTQAANAFLGGLTAKQVIDKYSPAARVGDTQAAFLVYQAEELCSKFEFRKEGALGMSRSERATFYAQDMRDIEQACVGVTPALEQERLAFLRQAAEGGLDSARVAFFMQGPNGYLTYQLTGEDQSVKEWSADALKYLRASVDDGNRLALTLLAGAYANGRIVEHDPQQALMYAAADAQLRNGQPENDAWVKLLSAGMPAEQVHAAIEQGQQLAAACCSKSKT